MNKFLRIVASLVSGWVAMEAAALAQGVEGPNPVCQRYVRHAFRAAVNGSRREFEEKYAHANEEVANVWLMVDRDDIAELIRDVDRRAHDSFQKHDLKTASDRLYCGLDCAAMFGRSLAWGNGHLEGVDMHQARPLIWLDSFAQMDLDVDGIPADKTFSFSPQQYIAAVNNYAYYLQLQGKHEEAAPIFERIIEIDPARTVAYLNLADSLWDMGERKLSRVRYSEYVEQCRKKHYASVPGRARERFLASSIH